MIDDLHECLAASPFGEFPAKLEQEPDKLKTLRRRIEDALRKTATAEDMVWIASRLNVRRDDLIIN